MGTGQIGRVNLPREKGMQWPIDMGVDHSSPESTWKDGN